VERVQGFETDISQLTGPLGPFCSIAQNPYLLIP